MPEEQRYRVRGAILVKRAGGSAWTLTFEPLPVPPGAPFDPDASREIVITLSPDKVDDMYFQTTYTRAEIDTMVAEDAHGA